MKKYKCAYCERALETDYIGDPLCDECHKRFFDWIPYNRYTFFTYNYLVACLLLKEGRPDHYVDQIIDNLEACVVDDCGDGNDYYDIGKLYQKRQKFAEALEMFEKSCLYFRNECDSDPENEWVMAELTLKMSQVLQELGREVDAKCKLQEAITQFRVAYKMAHEEAKRDISRTPRFAEVCVDLAEAYRFAGDLNSAIGFYKMGRAAFTISAGMDRDYYCRLAAVDTTLIELLQQNEETPRLTTKYIIERLQTEVAEIEQMHSNSRSSRME